MQNVGHAAEHCNNHPRPDHVGSNVGQGGGGENRGGHGQRRHGNAINGVKIMVVMVHLHDANLGCMVTSLNLQVKEPLTDIFAPWRILNFVGTT